MVGGLVVEMLSIGKLATGQEKYYLDLAQGRVDRGGSVASGVEDYYLAGAEAAGVWTGALSSDAGVQGQVDEGDLRELLGRAASTRRAGRVPGFDLTFSAPKSLSVVFGLAPEAVRREVVAAHDLAVSEALAFLERNAAFVRRGRDGREVRPADGFVAAAFRHRTSRAGDPQLHTHVLVANRTRGADGRWSSLDARHVYRHAKTAGFVYQAVLRSELSRSLAVSWAEPRRGVRELVGMGEGLLRAFSRRRVEIEQELERRGTSSRRAAQVAALSTRRAKDYRATPETLVPEWRSRALERGFGPGELREVLTAGGRDGPLPELSVERLVGRSGLTRSRSTFSRRDVVQELAEWIDPRVATSSRELERLADRVLASRHVVRVTAVGEARYSTPELLAMEADLIRWLADGQDAQRGMATAPAITRALRSRPTLFSEQAAMVRQMLQNGAALQVVVGKAGTGKTFALDAAREAWQASGLQVVGAAVALRAARELEVGAGIPSSSLAGLLMDLRTRPAATLKRNAVVVLDEAGMAPTRDLHALAAAVRARGAKLVLVGDMRQLPEIQAGGMFGALAVRGHALELRENRRQREAWERSALAGLRAGNAGRALECYLEHGRLVASPDAEAVRDRIVRDWWAARDDGEALMIAFRRSDVEDLNGRARALMRAAGRLGTAEVAAPGGRFAAGDCIVIRANSRRLGIANGDRGVVTAVDRAASRVDVRLHDGRRVALPRDFLLACSGGRAGLQHGYAVTGHVAQGMTTDRTFVLGTNRLFREWGYVALSRGRHENRLYAVVGEPRAREEVAPIRRRHSAGWDELSDGLERSERQLAAVDERLAAEYRELGDGPLRLAMTELRVRARLSNGSSAEIRARLVAARDETLRRAAIRTRAARLEPSGETLRRLGEPPDRPSAREQWESQAARLSRPHRDAPEPDREPGAWGR